MPRSTYEGAACELLDIAVADGVAVMTIHHEHPACVLTLPLNMQGKPERHPQIASRRGPPFLNP